MLYVSSGSFVQRNSKNVPGISGGNILVMPMVKLSDQAFYDHITKKERRIMTSRNENDTPHGPFRDTIRIKKLHDAGWNVFSVSGMESRNSGYFGDNHIEATLIQSTSKSRGFIQLLREKIPCTKTPFFDIVALDYIRMYTSYARQCWTTNFWSDTILALLTEGYISSETPLYISNFEAIENNFLHAQRVLAAKQCYLSIEPCETRENPLFSATDLATRDLERVGDPNTNSAYIQSRRLQKLEHDMFRVTIRGIERCKVLLSVLCRSQNKISINFSI